MTIINIEAKVSRRNRRRQPYNPADVAEREAMMRRDPSTWGLDVDALALPANSDVSVDGTSLKNVTRAQRYDIFSRLFFGPRARMLVPSYDAVRRLQKDLAIMYATQGATGEIRTTDAGSRAWYASDFAKTRVEASGRIELVLFGRVCDPDEGVRIIAEPMPRWAANLIRTLAEHGVLTGDPPNWRKIVRQVTGEIEPHAQGDLVVRAANDLRDSYERIDRDPKIRRREAA